MQRFHPFLAGVASLGVLAFLLGCQTEPAADTPAAVAEAPPDTVEEHDHEHAHEGPHGGHLIELGRNHEYHAELVEDHDAETVTVYILDKETEPLAVEAENITLNLTAGGQPQSFQFVPAEVAEGKASSFVASDAALFQALETNPEATGRLQVTIAGVPYTGEFSHEEHEHDHGDHKH